ncbi:MAG: hypothetical protein J0I07_05305, partial [Myxococcales bacterium]|nr:hypothetical protein [Myxococcales bacterium]
MRITQDDSSYVGRFDLTILDREARRHGVMPLVDRVGGSDGLLVVDPYVLDKQVNRFRKGRRNLSLLCEAFNVPLTDAHAAGADALAAARLAWRMGNMYPEIGEADIFELHEQQIGWALEQAASLQRGHERSSAGAAVRNGKVRPRRPGSAGRPAGRRPARPR